MNRHHVRKLYVYQWPEVLAPVGRVQQVGGNPDRCSELARGHGDKLVACEWRDGDLTLTLRSDLCSGLTSHPPPATFLQKYIFVPEPVNVTLYGKKVFADN